MNTTPTPKTRNLPHKPPAHLTTIIDHRDGHPITVGERIIEYVRTGQFVELAAAATGVHKDMIHDWLRNAARTRLRAKGTNYERLDLTDHQKACLAFSDGVLKAAGEWVTRANLDLDRLSRGGIPITKTVVTERTKIDFDPVTMKTTERVIERTRVTTTETTLPDSKVLMWRMERRFMPYFGRRIEIETTGADSTPELPAADVTESLGDAIEEWMRDRDNTDPELATVGAQVADVIGPKQTPTPREEPKRQARDSRGHIIPDHTTGNANGNGNQ